MLQRASALMFLVTLSACTGDNPMRGSTADGEQFTGVLRTNPAVPGVGDVDLRNAKGMRCLGALQLGSNYRGTITLTCEDGRTGLGDLVVAGTQATMTGTLGGKPFTATVERNRNYPLDACRRIT